MGSGFMKSVAAARPIQGRDLLILRHGFSKRPIRGCESDRGNTVYSGKICLSINSRQFHQE